MSKQRKALMIYTGGTIGMIQDSNSSLLKPFDFNALLEHIPELAKLDVQIDSKSFKQPIDSSNMQPHHWAELATIIADNYKNYDGFVVLHGSDTMAFTASALSFMLENLNKPVILTGSQLPIGTIRTDGKENIITAIEIASSYIDNKPVVPEVAIYFEYRLHRGNRTSKVSASQFNAFNSGNYPLLAEAGVNIDFNLNAIKKLTNSDIKLFTDFNSSIALLKIFPGIGVSQIEAVLNGSVSGAIIETFGSGNMTTDKNIIAVFKKFIDSGKPIVNITQCHTGFVEQGKYETSSLLNAIGVISGRDMTTESAVTKLMYVLGKKMNLQQIADAFNTNYCGEVTI